MSVLSIPVVDADQEDQFAAERAEADARAAVLAERPGKLSALAAMCSVREAGFADMPILGLSPERLAELEDLAADGVLEAGDLDFDPIPDPPAEEEPVAVVCPPSPFTKIIIPPRGKIGAGRVRSRTLHVRRLSRDERKEVQSILGELSPDDLVRPKTRADCATGPRPCPWVSCKYHLYLDVNPGTNTIKINFREVELEDMPETCALDVATRGGVTLEAAAVLINLTRERIRQIEERTFGDLRFSLGALLAPYLDKGGPVEMEGPILRTHDRVSAPASLENDPPKPGRQLSREEIDRLYPNGAPPRGKKGLRRRLLPGKPSPSMLESELAAAEVKIERAKLPAGQYYNRPAVVRAPAVVLPGRPRFEGPKPKRLNGPTRKPARSRSDRSTTPLPDQHKTPATDRRKQMSPATDRETPAQRDRRLMSRFWQALKAGGQFWIIRASKAIRAVPSMVDGLCETLRVRIADAMVAGKGDLVTNIQLALSVLIRGEPRQPVLLESSWAEGTRWRPATLPGFPKTDTRVEGEEVHDAHLAVRPQGAQAARVAVEKATERTPKATAPPPPTRAIDPIASAVDRVMSHARQQLGLDLTPAFQITIPTTDRSSGSSGSSGSPAQPAGSTDGSAPWLQACRKTEDGRYSVLDIIKNFKKTKDFTQAWYVLRQRRPDLVDLVGHFQFPGARQHQTPVITLAGLPTLLDEIRASQRRSRVRGGAGEDL